MSHNVFASDSDYMTFTKATSCGVAVWDTNKVGIDNLKIDGITVGHSYRAQTDKGYKWPILVIGVARISVFSPAVAGEKAWVHMETGRIYGSYVEGCIQTTNVEFASDGMEPIFGINQVGIVPVPVPDFYMPLIDSIEEYRRS